MKFSSMYKYCQKRLKFSDGETQRRLAAARLLKDLPEIEQQIEAGDLNITNLARVETFLRAEKSADHELNKTEKLELLQQMENKSTREVERELIGLSHQPTLMAEKFQASTRLNELGLEFTKFEAFLGPDQLELLNEFRNFYAHELPDHADGSVLVFLLEKAVHFKKKKLGLLEKDQTKTNSKMEVGKKAELEIKNKDTVSQQNGNTTRNATNVENSQNAAPLPSAPKVHFEKATSLRKTLKISVQREAWRRAESCCQQLDPGTQTRCRSRFALEIDHVIPIALGGTDDIVNLQLLCQAHNSRRAMKTFGRAAPH